MSNLKQLLQIPPYATPADISRTVNQIITNLVPGFSDPEQNTDWNNLTVPGLYLNSSAASHAPNTVSANYFCMTMGYATSKDVVQVAMPYDTADGMYVRTYYGGAWSVWTACSSGGGGTVTDFTFTNANGFTGTVSNPMTTPDLTIAGPITTKGDILVGDSGGVQSRLAIGTSGQVPTVTGGTLVYATPSAGFSNPMTTQGDIIIENATPAPARLAIGTTGQVLTVSSGLPAWGTGFVNPMTTTGDMIYSSDNSGTPARLAYVSDNDIILGAGGIPTWATPPFPIPSSQLFTSSGTWSKPSNATYVSILVFGSGGSGANGTTSAWGAGGGSGSSTLIMLPAIYVATTLYVFINNGSSLASYVSNNNDSGGQVSQNTYAYAVGGTNASGETGGLGGTLPVIGNMLQAYYGQFQFYVGSAGSNNPARLHPYLSGGANGGQSVATQGNEGQPGYVGYSVAAFGIGTGAGGGSSGTYGGDGGVRGNGGNAGNGGNGVNYGYSGSPGILSPCGGAGGGGGGDGGGSGVTPVNGGNGGNGGSAGYGCGGGGGGEAGHGNSGGTNGTPGTGASGGGAVVQISWV